MMDEHIIGEEILFENLDYGAYVLDFEPGVMEENVKYGTADFNKLHVRRVRLPDGRGNMIYLLARTFEQSIDLIKNKYFITPPSYRRIYFPWWYVGTFMSRRYKVSVSNLKESRQKYISENTKLRPIVTRTISKTTDNLFFCCSDLYEEAEKTMSRYTAKRNYTEFFGEFTRIVGSMTPENAKESTDPNWNNHVLLIDAESFGFKMDSPLKENKTNPLFLLYLAYMRTRDLSKINVDQDMMICSNNMFLKFNPKHLSMANWPVFRRGLFRIMNADLDAYEARLSEEEKNELDLTPEDETVSKVIKDAVDPFVRMTSTSTKAFVADTVETALRKQAAVNAAIAKEVKAATTTPVRKEEPDLFQKSLASTTAPKKLPTGILTKTVAPKKGPQQEKAERLFKYVANGYKPLGVTTGRLVDDDDDEDFEKPDDLEPEEVEEVEEIIRADAVDTLTQNPDVAEAILDEVQDKVAPAMKSKKTAPVNSARDRKLREEQKKVQVKGSTIEQILERDATNIPIIMEDKSAVMHTTNKNMCKIQFANFDRTYIDELYMKHLVSCFDSLQDKDSPFYITGIEIRDTSDIMNYQETWTVHMVDENKKRHTIKVDIPKFQDDRFMYFRGTKWIILKQNFYNPLVKDTPDTVILTTNYNKITIRRKANKSLSTVERIFSLIKKTGDSKVFVTGDSTRGNMKYVSTLEYDEMARRLFKFSSGNCELYFSRDYIKENLMDRAPKDLKGKEFFIGHVGPVAICIDEDTGLDRQGRTIADIIEENLPNEYKATYNAIKAPKQLMYAEGKLANEFIPIITTLIVWVGLKKALDRMGIQWEFDPNAKRVPPGTAAKKYIRFADGVLEYESKTFAELILNGLNKMHPEQYRFEDFENETGYEEFIYSQWGSYSGINQLKTFYEFLVDPITKNVCRDMNLPQDAPGLLINAVKLLADNAYVSKASDTSYRVRSVEMIPAILYGCIARQYQAYVRSGRRIPMSINQRCVISTLIAEKTVEAYSTLNPVIEVSKTHTISTKGYKGSNSEHSYDEEKRSYDPTSVGKLAISTSADANVGINKSLVIEPTIVNALGYRDAVDDPGALKDVNVFSPVEMLTPGTARNDDPIRTAIACKQSQHVVPVKDASPALISNGFDEAVQFHLSDDFVINAEEDGKVVDVNNETGFIIVQYNSGKTKAINTKPEIVKNSGGGFYMANQLTPVYTKVGQRFKKNEPLAYHANYFRYSKANGLRYAIGPISKVAFMSSYNTYEDAGIATRSLADRMKTTIVYKEDGGFRRNNNIISMVKVGDHVNIGDSLIKFDVSVEENELAKFLSKLNDENAALLEEETKTDIKTHHAGKVIDIKVYTLLEPSNLSPSLAKVVQQYFDQGTAKRKYLEQYDDTPGIVKAGYMLMDSTEPIKDPYNAIKGKKGIDVLIEIYIAHDDVMGVGDKVALYGPNKQIISEVIPKGWEPYSEFRPDEEISVLTSPGTVARRMTPSIIPLAAAMKCLIELKRKIKKDIRYSK